MEYACTLMKLSKTPKLTAACIEGVFKKRHGVSVTVCNTTIEKPGFKVVSDQGVFFLLERPLSYYNKNWGRVTSIQQRMLKFSIPVPLYIGEGEISRTFNQAEISEDPHAAVEMWIRDIFEPDLVAAYFSHYFAKSEVFTEYRLIILEAIESFYMGLDHVAVVALVPVLEGALRKLQNKSLCEEKNTTRAEEFGKNLREILKSWGARRVSEYDWHLGVCGVPDLECDFYTHICPQSDVINCFRLFFTEILYKPSLSPGAGLNRHVIVHMLGGGFDSATDFYKLFLALTHIAFIESLTNRNVPFFWQGYSDSSRRLGEYLRRISIIMDKRRDLIKAFEVPEYPKGAYPSV
ncbi:MAG: hypothetical protein ABS977_13705 [Pseudomonas qingdaonensis]|uniref:hypothetical protein n=1 Tax=Pseudomonas TaxID=286 RepID=UPI0033146D1B